MRVDKLEQVFDWIGGAIDKDIRAEKFNGDPRPYILEGISPYIQTEADAAEVILQFQAQLQVRMLECEQEFVECKAYLAKSERRVAALKRQLNAFCFNSRYREQVQDRYYRASTLLTCCWVEVQRLEKEFDRLVASARWWLKTLTAMEV